ncbi:signal transduction histidine kinase [Bacillus sp. OxB-1]|uniref:sensor histidine kinase n=1 Tax=Bacillus sp. (strain OxB-1) TaxID=98228 RepID=UPI000581D3B3|nr:histidine kinase dimerization/phospho-acceptor domain-containing protein [Bacillus sp. OxB-1]BAQ09691.1 signal transduction histidine kinase [Bacillus sp. OxB-1]
MKKSHGFALTLWSAFAAIFLLALLTFIQDGSRYIGKSYIDLDEFQRGLDDFYQTLGSTVLNPINIEAEKKRISVSKAEIEEHRNRYGTLSEQIENIEMQYEERIADAEAGNSERLKDALVKERDSKIEDIRQNFEDDAHVEAKVRAEKEAQLESYLRDYINNLKSQSTLPAAYELKDVDTGEVFSSGDINAPAVYEQNFNVENGYFKAESIRDSDLGYHGFDDMYGEHAPRVQVETESPFKEETATSASDAATVPQSEIAAPIRSFEGTVIVPKSMLSKGELGRDVRNFNWTKTGMYILWGIGLLALIAMVTVFRFKKEWVTESRLFEQYNRLKIDFRVALLLFSAFWTFIALETIPGRYSWFFYRISVDNIVSLGILFVFYILFTSATAFQIVAIWERLKVEGAFERELKSSYAVKFLKALQDMFLNRKIGTQMLFLLIGFFLAGIGFAGVLLQPSLIVVYAPLALFIGMPFIYIFVRRTAYLNRIMIATEAMAEGRLQKEIGVEGKSPLAKHAANLNNVREGVRISMSEQAKSERLKTELITNVSHDLRTPLTSIITYTDLLKNEGLSIEDRLKYVDILDKKSQRLKTLIEDLFDVSKMASGNMELTKQRVDLTQLLQQALAEHAAEIEESGLDFRTTMPELPLIAYVDGQRWWRVLDNLIVNAIKYTLPGTRVYISLRQVGSQAEFVVKNVTKYELGENVDELFERFKRADTSRHTDGSGLGLAIAQSIVDLHGGMMKIEVDGDLFKVTVTVPALPM